MRFIVAYSCAAATMILRVARIGWQFSRLHCKLQTNQNEVGCSGRSHGELGRFTAHSLADEMNSVEVSQTR